jgi:hypothetical protein
MTQNLTETVPYEGNVFLPVGRFKSSMIRLRDRASLQEIVDASRYAALSVSQLIWHRYYGNLHAMHQTGLRPQILYYTVESEKMGDHCSPRLETWISEEDGDFCLLFRSGFIALGAELY